ncbi:MAG: hypothetical protein IIZ68_02455 [Clostridia bacterium]|nr:hypothetical protein [Clostridia bacterium]
MKKIISFALILVLLLVGCTVAPTESDMIPESAESDNSTTSIIVNDWWTTPIFFGEWEVKRVIPGGRFTLDKQEALEQLVGETVTFANNVVCLGDALLVDNPTYESTIVPISHASEVVQYYWPESEEDRYYSDDDPFFVLIFVRGAWSDWESTSGIKSSWIDEFVIKDEDTLVFLTSYGLLELTRISYPEHYGVFP